MIELQRVKVKGNAELLPMNTYILALEKSDRPRIIKLSDCYSELLEEYKPRPQQCFNYLRYGHVAKDCRRETLNCLKCGPEGQKSSECENVHKCYHCKAQHWANNKQCRKYIIETEIVVTATKLRTTRAAATDTVLSRFPEVARLYSETTRRGKIQLKYRRDYCCNKKGERKAR